MATNTKTDLSNLIMVINMLQMYPLHHLNFNGVVEDIKPHILIDKISNLVDRASYILDTFWTEYIPKHLVTPLDRSPCEFNTSAIRHKDDYWKG